MSKGWYINCSVDQCDYVYRTLSCQLKIVDQFIQYCNDKLSVSVVVGNGGVLDNIVTVKDVCDRFISHFEFDQYMAVLAELVIGGDITIGQLFGVDQSTIGQSDLDQQLYGHMVDQSVYTDLFWYVAYNYQSLKQCIIFLQSKSINGKSGDLVVEPIPIQYTMYLDIVKWVNQVDKRVVVQMGFDQYTIKGT